MDKQSLKIEHKLSFVNQIVSPLAKYDSNGNLFCIICKNFIKSSSIWKVHVNSKVHKLKVEEAKKVNKKVLEKSLQKHGNCYKESQTTLNLENLNIKKSMVPSINDIRKLTPKQDKGVSVLRDSSEILPKIFFDDAVDAKNRHVEYKDVQNDEWERFQREMKEESVSSNKIILGDQTNSAFDREITEISEQIYQWSKVIDLENKLQNIVKREKAHNDLEESDETLSEDEVDDYLDWRSKKFT